MYVPTHSVHVKDMGWEDQRVTSSALYQQAFHRNSPVVLEKTHHGVSVYEIVEWLLLDLNKVGVNVSMVVILL